MAVQSVTDTSQDPQQESLLQHSDSNCSLLVVRTTRNIVAAQRGMFGFNDSVDATEVITLHVSHVDVSVKSSHTIKTCEQQLRDSLAMTSLEDSSRWMETILRRHVYCGWAGWQASPSVSYGSHPFGAVSALYFSSNVKPLRCRSL